MRYRHYARELYRGLHRLRLEVLDELIASEIARNSPNPALDDHSVLMTLGAEQNKRALRRFLRHWSERGGNCDEHPRNQRWLARLTPQARQIWTRGMRREGDGLIAGFERDPREILRAGTLVGSCLGLGACYSSAASALVLDANKRVIFVRDAAKGRFVARQIVVITQNWQLAFLPIYPLKRQPRRSALDFELRPGFAPKNGNVALWGGARSGRRAAVGAGDLPGLLDQSANRAGGTWIEPKRWNTPGRSTGEIRRAG